MPADTKLSELHLMLQAAMGWGNCHLHSFTIDGVDYGAPDPDYGDQDLEDERRVRLDELVPAVRMRFAYLYDFGDGWEHEIVVEKIMPSEPGVQYPVCVEGERACPPEDCGGIWGYYELLEAINDPSHEQHEEMVEWAGHVDPEAFDVKRTNRWLKDIKRLDHRGW